MLKTATYKLNRLLDEEVEWCRARRLAARKHNYGLSIAAQVKHLINLNEVARDYLSHDIG